MRAPLLQRLRRRPAVLWACVCALLPARVLCAGTDIFLEDFEGNDLCVWSAVANPEQCNALDDDCDLLIDEEFPLGDSCSAGVGACENAGQLVCNQAGSGTVCDAVPGSPSPELCGDAIDNDCDGDVDEGFPIGASCSAGVGACETAGVTVCNGAGTGVECDAVPGSPSTELCGDAIDNDCDGLVDEGFSVGASCSVGVGACEAFGVLVCDPSGTGVQCNAVAGTPTAEICGDDIDQDCNGADATCPANDAPAGAIDVTAGGTFVVDLSQAVNDQDYAGTGCGSTGGRDVFYTFTLPAAELVYVDTFGSNFDTTLRLFAGSCAALGAWQTCWDDQCSSQRSQGALQLDAGQYCLVVDQYSSTQTNGALALNFVRGGRTGTPLPPSPVSSTSCSGTNATTPSCQANSTAQDKGYWFLACPAQTRVLSANLCTGTAFDSVLDLRKSGGSVIACSDDSVGCGPSGVQSSFANANAIGPGLFWVTVDGFQSACGTFTLTYTLN